MKQLTTYLRIFGCSLHRSLITWMRPVYSSIMLLTSSVKLNRKPLNSGRIRCSGLFCLGLCYICTGRLIKRTLAFMAKALLGDSCEAQTVAIRDERYDTRQGRTPVTSGFHPLRHRLLVKAHERGMAPEKWGLTNFQVEVTTRLKQSWGNLSFTLLKGITRESGLRVKYYS